MMLVRMKSCINYKTEILPKGHHYVDIPLNELVFFIRNNKAIPFGKTVENTSKLDFHSLKLLGYFNCSYVLYFDNGISLNPEDNLNISTL